MTLLASALTQLRPRYDVLVVGSGYGGSIAASLLARTKKAGEAAEPVSVCLLERGREIPLGQFPATAEKVASQLQVNAKDHRLGDKDSLFWLHAGEDISVLHGCGLGGTSLINANVSLPPEKRVWQDPRWPRGIIEDLEDGIVAGFNSATAMLRPEPYPGKSSEPRLPPLKKYATLRRSAESMGVPSENCYHPPINVNFEERLNHVGLKQLDCNGCGDCVSGCNRGSKNTLMMNYLPDAKNHGAEIFCRVDVTRIEKRADGWRVHFQPVGAEREKFDGGELFVDAGLVIVSAGSLGSTEVVLRSKRAGLACSNQVGKHFTGNGDVLGFSYNSDTEVNAMGLSKEDVTPEEAPGPCIAGIIDRRSGGDYAQAHVIEEGVIPGAIAAMLPGPLSLVAELTGQDTDSGIWDSIAETARQWASALPGGAYRGAMRNTQTYLMMSHDPSNGSIQLAGEGVEVVWPDVGASDHFKLMNQQLVEATSALGGTYVASPTFNQAFGYGLTTVHPLGGCSMAEDANSGVTDHKGRLFSGTEGSDVYDSLYVADGSVLPCSVGVNPLFTISAIAERNIRLLATDRGWLIDDSPTSGPAQYDGSIEPDAGTSIQFTERMAGHCSTTVLSDGQFQEAERAGEQESSPCQFVFTISSPDVQGMIDEPNHTAAIVGTITAPALSAAPMSVFGGCFNLFVQDDTDPGLKRMRYQATMRSVEEDTFFFDGTKLIKDDSGADVWSDTTTLYITIHRGTDVSAPKVAQGILHISKSDFATQMTTMKATAPDGCPAPEAVVDFGKLFARSLWAVYGL